ncbi:nuclear transport factor 2 family protein [Moraxella porci]|uniref:nuclear transport factor 2 family protein n=1 Tax=Moraxella porci TaxID=1288392 RepID=UPI001D171340
MRKHTLINAVNLSAKFAKAFCTLQYTKTHQVLAHGDFALAVSEGTFAGKPTAFYDLFRVENGKIAEHWDVIETIAEPSTWQNQNGKF